MTESPTRVPRRPARAARAVPALLLAALAAGCASSNVLPDPRPLVVTSGARLQADPERLQEIWDWFIPQTEAIEQDPTFWIIGVPAEEDTYPWETLVVVDAQIDTVRYQYSRSSPDVDTSYNIYGHYHLMRERGELERWLPGADTLEGYALEREMVSRMADSWLLGRAIFDAQPHELMDELIYAKDAGYLDAFLFTARPEEFDEAREAWIAANPGRLEQYAAWFRETLGGEPRGLGDRGDR